MYQALYRKWRPKVFSDVCGQEHVTSILQYEVENNRVSHAYLFCGSRGTGKTSCAKILAKAVNCLKPEKGNPCGKCEACLAIENGTTTDVLEMDAASNNGVDYIRDIRDDVVYSPSMLKNRVYIIDEVHMLSGSAFNALLKTLEEPPAQVIFILATTELPKIPSTVLSRCQRFDFRRIPNEVICNRLLQICEKEEIFIEPAAAEVIAGLSLGGMRDAIGLLEICASGGRNVTQQSVYETAGLSGHEVITTLVRAVREKDYSCIFEQIHKQYQSSSDLVAMWQELLSYYRDMMVIKSCPKSEDLLLAKGKQLSAVRENAEGFSMDILTKQSEVLLDALQMMQRNNASTRTIVEFALIRMCSVEERQVFYTEASVDGLGDEKKNTSSFIDSTKLSALTTTPKIEKKETENKSEEKKELHVSSLEGKTIFFSEMSKLHAEISRSDPAGAAFIKNSTILKKENDSMVYVFTDKRFSCDMLKDPTRKTLIASILTQIDSLFACTAEMLVIEYQEKNEKTLESLDEILKKTEDE